MISVDCLHISLNRTLLLSVGLWPYQQSKLVQFQIVLLSALLTTCIIFQLTTFLTSKCTVDLLINVISSALFFVYLFIQYISFRINIKVVKCLLERLLNIYNDLTDMNEISIMKEYGSYAKRYTVGLMLLVIIFVPVPILYPFWSHILLSTNKSLPRPPLSGMFATEYFIDQKRYFYWILLHGYAALLVGIITVLATGTLFIAYLQYACGMFRIASYRLEQALAISTLQKGNPRNKNLIYKELIHAVDMHRKAMNFSDSSVSKFKLMFFFMIIVIMISASLNLFRIFQALLFGYGVEELLLPLISVISYILYIFIGDYIGQEIIDHNNDIFTTAYNIQWYAASLNIQKMILFLLQRNTKLFSLNIAGLFMGSLEGSVSLFNTILSYFTVLYSVRT